MFDGLCEIDGVTLGVADSEIVALGETDGVTLAVEDADGGPDTDIEGEYDVDAVIVCDGETEASDEAEGCEVGDEEGDWVADGDSEMEGDEESDGDSDSDGGSGSVFLRRRRALDKPPAFTSSCWRVWSSSDPSSNSTPSSFSSMSSS